MKNRILRVSIICACLILWPGLVGFRPDPMTSSSGQIRFYMTANADITDINIGFGNNKLHSFLPNKMLMTTAQILAGHMVVQGISNQFITVNKILLNGGIGDETANAKIKINISTFIALVVVVVFGLGLLSFGIFLKK